MNSTRPYQDSTKETFPQYSNNEGLSAANSVFAYAQERQIPIAQAVEELRSKNSINENTD